MAAGEAPGIANRINEIGRERPDLTLMGPYLAYLLLLAVRDVVPVEWQFAANLLRGVGPLVLVWIWRKHLPPLGRPHLALAIGAGLLAAAGWAAGHHFFVDTLGLPRRLPLLPGAPGDPAELSPFMGVGPIVAWINIVTKIAVAVITVAIVEELFWRGFLLRALIDWAEFEKVPLGAFTWFSFIGTSLISTVQHPDTWAVSIPCWLFFNALMIWKKSLLMMMITHGLTNLFLYIYVLYAKDWALW